LTKDQIDENNRNLKNNNLLKQKKFKKLFKRLLGKDLYESIDLHLINLEDKSGNLEYKNIKDLSKLFTNGISINSPICNENNLYMIENIKNFSKLKLKKKLFSDKYKYIFDIFEISKILKVKISNENNFDRNYNNYNNYEDSQINHLGKESYGDLKLISKFSNFNNNPKKFKLPAEEIMLFLRKFSSYMNESITISFSISENHANDKKTSVLIDLLDFILEVYRLNTLFSFNSYKHNLEENNIRNNNIAIEDNISTSELNNNDQKINNTSNDKLHNLDNQIQNNKNKDYLISSIKFNIISGSNLIILDKPLSFKPNSYFVFNYGSEETFISNAILQASNPEWQQEIEIKIPIKTDLNNIEDKNFLIEHLSKNISVTIFSKNIPSEEIEKLIQSNSNQFNLNNIITNNVSSQEILSNKNIINPFATINNLNPNLISRDEFIGETNIGLFEILKNLVNDSFSFYNNMFVHEGFYHMYNRKDNIVGQIKIKIFFEENLVNCLRENINISSNTTNNNLNNINNNSNNINKYTSTASRFEFNRSGNILEMNSNLNFKVNSNLNNNKNSGFDKNKYLNDKENVLSYNANNEINIKLKENNNLIKFDNFKSVNKNINEPLPQSPNQNLEEMNSDLLWKKIKENEVR